MQESPGATGVDSSYTSNVPAFLTKLWTLVEDPETNHLICWSAVSSTWSKAIPVCVCVCLVPQLEMTSVNIEQHKVKMNAYPCYMNVISPPQSVSLFHFFVLRIQRQPRLAEAFVCDLLIGSYLTSLFLCITNSLSHIQVKPRALLLYLPVPPHIHSNIAYITPIYLPILKNKLYS